MIPSFKKYENISKSFCLALFSIVFVDAIIEYLRKLKRRINVVIPNNEIAMIGVAAANEAQGTVPTQNTSQQSEPLDHIRWVDETCLKGSIWVWWLENITYFKKGDGNDGKPETWKAGNGKKAKNWL